MMTFSPAGRGRALLDKSDAEVIDIHLRDLDAILGHDFASTRRRGEVRPLGRGLALPLPRPGQAPAGADAGRQPRLPRRRLPRHPLHRLRDHHRLRRRTTRRESPAAPIRQQAGLPPPGRRPSPAATPRGTPDDQHPARRPRRPGHPATTDGALDETALRALVDRTIDGGVHGVVACGSTGEFTALTTDERRRVVETVVDQTAGRVPVVAQTGATSTAEAIELTAPRRRPPVSPCVMPVAPYYEPLTLDETLHYLRRVADSVAGPDDALQPAARHRRQPRARR